MLEKELKKIAVDGGASDVGFAFVGDVIPNDLPDNLKNAVSFCYKLSPSVMSTVKDRPTIMYFQHYRAVNARLDQIALDIVRFIEEAGYFAFPVAASQSRPDEHYNGVFSHKIAAYRAGMGDIGKNGLFISVTHGITVRLCTVLTDMPLEYTEKRENLCAHCDKCVNACPAGAISGKCFDPEHPETRLIDPAKCSRHMKTYSDVGRGAVCGLCMIACPYAHK